MRILWVSNSPFAPSGYGQQTAVTTKVLRDMGHEVHIFANYRLKGDESGTFDGDIPVYDSGYPRSDSYRGLGAHVLALRPDLVIVLADAWTLTYPKVAKEFMFFPTSSMLAIYSPVDADVLSPRELPVYAETDYALAMSQHAAACMLNEGVENIFYVPHMVDDTVFRIKNGGRSLPIIGMVHANYGTRKLIPLQLEALSLLKEMYEDPFQVLVHSDLLNERQDEHSVDYGPLIKQLGLDGILFQSWNPDKPATPEDMADVYNNCTVLLHTTAGEGFGIPIVEAGLCGVPALVTDNSAARCFSWVHKVPPAINEYAPHLLARHSWPHPREIAKRLLIMMRHGVDQVPSMAVRRAAGHFSTTLVPELYWRPFLEAVESGVKADAGITKNLLTA